MIRTDLYWANAGVVFVDFVKDVLDDMGEKEYVYIMFNDTMLQIHSNDTVGSMCAKYYATRAKER